jgi:hypothetical protein
VFLNILINCCENLLGLTSELRKVGSREYIVKEIDFTSVLFHCWLAYQGDLYHIDSEWRVNIPQNYLLQEEHVFQAFSSQIYQQDVIFASIDNA